jgi:hypothetical protein
MKKHVKKKWLNALRSGNYTQGTDRLVDDDDNFCCLGVLCNIAPESAGKWTSYQDYSNKEEWGFEHKFGYIHTSILPKSVQKWAGLDSPNPLVYVINGDQYEITRLNDAGYTFEQLADIIEDQL